MSMKFYPTLGELLNDYFKEVDDEIPFLNANEQRDAGVADTDDVLRLATSYLQEETK